MTENGKLIFEFLKRNYGKEFTKHEIVERVDVTMAAVNCTVNTMIKKGYIGERIEVIPAKYKGQKDAEVRFVWLTEAGKNYDPDEEERRKAEAHLEELAARKAERARLKAERAKLNSVL